MLEWKHGAGVQTTDLFERHDDAPGAVGELRVDVVVQVQSVQGKSRLCRKEEEVQMRFGGT